MVAPVGAVEVAEAAETTSTRGSKEDKEQGELKGTVKDKTGGALVDAQVTLMTAQRAVIATTKTDKSGQFAFPGVADGQYLLVVKYAGLAERQTAVSMTAGQTGAIDVVLEPTKSEDVTVTASPGGVSDLDRLAQPVNIISADDILARARTVVAQAVDFEQGVHLQRTSPGMAGIFVRGLTGNKVNVFIDGVRFSNGAQRGGVNTFLDLIDPSTLDSIEVLRGTSSAQYGSDALGGSIQFLTKAPAFSATGEPDLTGSVTFGAESAHVGGMGNVSLGYARERFNIYGSAGYRKTGDYKPGDGEDSHAAVARFLGVPSSELYPERMPQTGFTQNAQQLRANFVPGSNWLVVANYLRTRQDGAHRWDQELGGDGNLIAELNDLQLDLAYLRVERMSLGWFDHASATYSFNTQREERVNQGGQGNPTGTITHQPERTTVNGIQANLTKQLSQRQSLFIGGDAYFEKLTSVATDVNPVTGVVTPSRPRIPDQATYNQGGFFVQTNFDVLKDRLSVVGAIRAGFTSYRASAADAPVVGGKPMWPDDENSTASVTYRAGGVYIINSSLSLTGGVSTGYRAPHMTDLGTLGLTGSGFEVAAPDVAGMNAFVGTTADANAVSTGDPVEQVTPESSLNFDYGARFKTSRVRIEFNGFTNTIDGNIQKQSLILPQGAVGTMLGGEVITSQTANGAVFVAASSNPVLVRANFDKARVWGVEWFGEFKVAQNTTIGSAYTYMEARDLNTDLPPNIEGGTPAPGGSLWLRYAMPTQKWWVQPYVVGATRQSNLSTLDQGDRRTGATRTRAQIQNYFRRGATVNGWVSAGTDGVFGNADDILIATGETLTQVQDRVLGVGVNSKPMFTSVAPYLIVGVRFGIDFGPHSFVVEGENLTNESYRGISWGMDGAARGITFRYIARW